MSIDRISRSSLEHRYGLQLPENEYHLAHPGEERELADRERKILEVFGDDEELLVLARRGLDRYPNHEYHNRKHGADVIESTIELVDTCDVFTEREKQLLAIAAAWHDAGFGDDDLDWRQFGSKEAYSVHIMREAAASILSSEEQEYVERAIMGTMMTTSVTRDTPEAQILHLADLSYLRGSPEDFRDGALRYRREELDGAESDEEFSELEMKFLALYAQTMEEYLGRNGLGLDDIALSGLVAGVFDNIQAAKNPEFFKNPQESQEIIKPDTDIGAEIGAAAAKLSSSQN